jgi:hypothetical protein
MPFPFPDEIIQGQDPVPADIQPVVLFIRLTLMLKEFGFNARIFLIALRWLSSVISGSAVLALLHPGRFQPGDLDIYVPYQWWLLFKIFLLLHRDIYLVEDPRTIGRPARHGPYPIPGVACVWYFHNMRTNKVINVIVTSTRYG